MREEKKTSLTDHSAWRVINEWAHSFGRWYCLVLRLMFLYLN